MKIVYSPDKKKYVNRNTIQRSRVGFYDIDIFQNARWEYLITASSFGEIINIVLALTKKDDSVKLRIVLTTTCSQLWTNVK